MPEQIGRSDVVVQRREDDLMKDRSAPWRTLVHETRGVALPGARFTFDQHGRMFERGQRLEASKRGEVRRMRSRELGSRGAFTGRVGFRGR
jgi:hypothetical protein